MGPGAGWTGCFSPSVFPFCLFLLTEREKGVGEPRCDDWILRLRGLILDGDGKWMYLQKPAAIVGSGGAAAMTLRATMSFPQCDCDL